MDGCIFDSKSIRLYLAVESKCLVGDDICAMYGFERKVGKEDVDDRFIS